MKRVLFFQRGEFYHIYNRGTEKRNIFTSNVDRERFLSLLFLCNSSIPVVLSLQGRTLEKARQIKRGDPLVQLCAYCLMPNHFHFLIRDRVKNGTSRFMQKLITGYTMYFNKRYERTGALFQGKFRATHIDNDRYLSYLIAYIHLNPVKLIEPKWKEMGITNRTKAEEYLNAYRYSSYRDFLGYQRIEKIILEKDALPRYFTTSQSFKQYISNWLDYKRLQGSTLEK